MTRDKAPEDLLGDYTDDLLTDRRPQLREGLVNLDETDRVDIVRLGALVRELKAAHTEPPPPGEGFLARLDAALAQESLARLAGKPGDAGGARRDSPGHVVTGRLQGVVFGFLRGWRWQLAGGAVIAILVVLHVQLVGQVRDLQQANRDLAARVEHLTDPPGMTPMRLPADVGLRLRIGQRIAELEKERAARIGNERQAVERAIQELKALVQSTQSSSPLIYAPAPSAAGNSALGGPQAAPGRDSLSGERR